MTPPKAAGRAAGKTRGRAKKRERPLGVVVGLAAGTIFAIAIAIGVVQLLVPHSFVSDFYRLVHFNPSATLPLDPLYQDWAQQIQNEDAVFGTAFPLLCGGLVLGRLAPSYETRRRVLTAAAVMALVILTAAVGFIWTVGVLNQTTMNAHEGGQQVLLTAPRELIVRQIILALAQAGVCVAGAWLGQRWRDRRSTASPA